MTIGPVTRAGTLAGMCAAAAVTVLAMVTRAAGVDFNVNGQAIPLWAFAWWVVVATILAATLTRIFDQRRFVSTCLLGTAASLIPAIAMPDDLATKLALVFAHLLVAAIVIPALARAIRRRAAGPRTARNDRIDSAPRGR